MTRPWDQRGSIVEFVKSMNLNRRMLSDSQKAMVAAKLANMKHGASDGFRGNQHTGGKGSIGPLPDAMATITQEQAAKLLNVGESSVKRARIVLARGSPALKRAVEADEISVNAAAEIANLPKPEQDKIVADGTASRKARHGQPPKVTDVRQAFGVSKTTA